MSENDKSQDDALNGALPEQPDAPPDGQLNEQQDAPLEEGGAPMQASPEAESESGEPTPEERLAEANDQLLRSLAELENTRKRAARDRSEALKFGAMSFARDMLGVVDNLQRALKAFRARCKLSTTPSISRAKLIAPNFSASLRSRAARLRVFSNSAELENTRKRAARDRSEALKFGAMSFARDMLGVVDNLQRALKAFRARCKLSTTPSISRAKLIAPNFSASLRSRAARLRVFSNSARLRKSWSLASASRSSGVGSPLSLSASGEACMGAPPSSSGASCCSFSWPSGGASGCSGSAPFSASSCDLSFSLMAFPYRFALLFWGTLSVRLS